ncbi:MAG: response regulator [Lachnospiraceae bacterium]|nr:response regulator [Lachnospiraceae bacterium]
MECTFIPFSVDEINKNWDENALVTFFSEEFGNTESEVLHYLTDRIEESDNRMILICEKSDAPHIFDQIPHDLIYETFTRPLDNESYMKTVREYCEKADAGELRKSILIVDDDPNYLALVRDWLKETYRVSMANSGLQAIKWLGKNKVDLILLDHEMPVTSGPQVLEMLRSENETKDIPVMFLTGKSDKESVMAVVALRPEGYFLKTIGKDELLNQLKDFFVLHK